MLCEMQSASSGIWTRVAVSIFNDDNHYTMGTAKYVCKWTDGGEGVKRVGTLVGFRLHK